MREAFEQNGVLSQADVAEMLGVSTGTVSKDIIEYQIENQVVSSSINEYYISNEL
ncbi:MAG: DUF1670 domain-containing protein [ANME-2 cluster archaeon]|nr:DUF1670 domain-containing protein [ANME-2 cluster archaeon]